MTSKNFDSYTKKALSETQIAKILSVCQTLEDSMLIKLAIEFGLRRGDISRLKVSDVHLDEQMLYFREQKKGDKIRKLPIKSGLCTELRQYINSINGTRKSLWSFESDRTAYNHMNELYHKAGYSRKIRVGKRFKYVPPFPFHALRGTCYKRLRAEGRTLEFAAAWLGDTVGIASQHYGIVTDAEIEDAIRRSDRGGQT